MEIENNKETIKACKYCLMCKHVCPSGSYKYSESDYTRGRALLLDRVLTKKNEYSEDIVNAIYNCFLCGSCWAHCEGNFNLTEAIKSSRFDITSLGLEPERVRKIRESILANGHPYYEEKLKPIEIEYDKHCGILYYLGPDIRFKEKYVVEAAKKVIKAASNCFKVLDNEPVTGKILYLLGYKQEAIAKAKILYKAILETKPKFLIVSDSLSYNAFVSDYPNWGLDLRKATKIMHISEFVIDSKIKFKKLKMKATLVDSEYLSRFSGLGGPPREILKGVFRENFIELRHKEKNMLPTGEAAFIFNGKEAKTDKLAKRIADEIEFSGADIVITLNAKARNYLGNLLKKEVYEFSEFLSKYIIT